MPKFPHYKQFDHKDCGPTCLKIIAKLRRRLKSLQEQKEINKTELDFKEKDLNPLYAIESLLHLVATANTNASLRFLISS